MCVLHILDVVEHIIFGTVIQEVRTSNIAREVSSQLSNMYVSCTICVVTIEECICIVYCTSEFVHFVNI